MRDNAATAHALRADEYEQRFLHSVDSPPREESRRPREPRPRAYGSGRGGSGAAMRPASGVPGRRTIEITGQASAPRRRPSTTSTAMLARPDRAAMWAFVLALFLVLMAVATAHG
jgi:hypothetical protein